MYQQLADLSKTHKALARSNMYIWSYIVVVEGYPRIVESPPRSKQSFPE